MKEIQPSSDVKMIKLLTFDDLFPSLWHYLNPSLNSDGYHDFPPNDAGTRAHYFVLRKSRSCSRPRLKSPKVSIDSDGYSHCLGNLNRNIETKKNKVHNCKIKGGYRSKLIVKKGKKEIFVLLNTKIQW